MARKRRNAEEARNEILAAAKTLLVDEGADALKLQRIARKAEISHPLVLHHFGSIEGVLVALQASIAREIRQTLLQSLQGLPVQEGVAHAMQALSSPHQGKLMAWLVSRGHSPFPPEGESGLLHIRDELQSRTGRNPTELNHMMLAILFAMYGEAMFGDDLRSRLQMTTNTETKRTFHHWLFRQLTTTLSLCLITIMMACSSNNRVIDANILVLGDSLLDFHSPDADIATVAGDALGYTVEHGAVSSTMLDEADASIPGSYTTGEYELLIASGGGNDLADCECGVNCDPSWT